MSIDNFTGSYGPDWKTGVVVDHLGSAVEAGMLVHTSPSGAVYVTGPKGGVAVPVVCGEIIMIDTEDGRIDGRCGLPVKADEGACPGHWAQIQAYRLDPDYDEAF